MRSMPPRARLGVPPFEAVVTEPGRGLSGPCAVAEVEGRVATPQQPRPDGRYDCCPEGDLNPCPERFVGHTVPCNAPYCSLHAVTP